MTHPFRSRVALVGASQPQEELLFTQDPARPDTAILHLAREITRLFRHRRIVISTTGRAGLEFRQTLPPSRPLVLVGASQSQSGPLPAHDSARPDAAILHLAGKITRLSDRWRIVISTTGRAGLEFKQTLPPSRPLVLVGASQSQSGPLPAHDLARPDAAILHLARKITRLSDRRRVVMAATGRAGLEFRQTLRYSLARPYPPTRYLTGWDRHVRKICKTQIRAENDIKAQTPTPGATPSPSEGRGSPSHRRPSTQGEGNFPDPSPPGGGQGEGVEGLHLGLVGWPLGHSLSPKLHNAALAALNLPGEYCLYPTPPFPEGQARLAELLDQVRKGALHGLNVTIPHKQNVLSLLDDLTPTAAAIGAANLIFLKAGRLTGDNADAAGFLADLQHNGLAVARASGTRAALVLGAGGSTRAVVYALANAGWQVWIAARRIEQASALVVSLHINGPDLHVLRLEPEALGDPYDLIVNTTPLGMFPDIETCPWPAGLPFPPGAGVYDLVYNPFETTLVRQARAAGLCAANGLGMLVNQAAIAFETWTGQPAPLDAMWAAVAQ